MKNWLYNFVDSVIAIAIVVLKLTYILGLCVVLLMANAMKEGNPLTELCYKYLKKNTSLWEDCED